jgi:hypothetical protein
MLEPLGDLFRYAALFFSGIYVGILIAPLFWKEKKDGARGNHAKA